MLVTDLAPEILHKIAHEVYLPYYSTHYTHTQYGPSMMSLAQTCKAFRDACYSFTYKKCDLTLRGYRGIRGLLQSEKWRNTVRELQIPACDWRLPGERGNRSLETFDATLAEVITFARKLTCIGICFDDISPQSINKPEHYGALSLLPRSLRACRERYEFSDVHIRGINTQEQATVVCDMLPHWSNLQSLSYSRGRDFRGVDDEMQLGKDLYAGAVKVKSLQRLVFDLPIMRSADPEDNAEICPAESSISSLVLGNLLEGFHAGDYLGGVHGRTVNSVLRNHMATLERLSIDMVALDAAVLAVSEPLLFPRLTHLSLETDLNPQFGQWPSERVEQGSKVACKLRRLLSTSPVGDLSITGGCPFSLLASLAYEHQNTFTHLKRITLFTGFMDGGRAQMAKDMATMDRICRHFTGIEIRTVCGWGAVEYD